MTFDLNNTVPTVQVAVAQSYDEAVEIVKKMTTEKLIWDYVKPYVIMMEVPKDEEPSKQAEKVFRENVDYYKKNRLERTMKRNKEKTTETPTPKKKWYRQVKMQVYSVKLAKNLPTVNKVFIYDGERLTDEEAKYFIETSEYTPYGFSITRDQFDLLSDWIYPNPFTHRGHE